MASSNAEVMLKTLDKRVAAIERALEGLTTLVKSAPDYSARMKDLSTLATRVDNLEKLVRAMVASRGDSKSVAVEKLEKAVHAIADEQRKQLAASQEKHAGRQVHRDDLRKMIEAEMSGFRPTQEAAWTAQLERIKADHAAKVEQARKATEAKFEQERKARDAETAELSKKLAKQEQDKKDHVTRAQLDMHVALIQALETRLAVLEKRN